mgnify:CR=1 FL=1
MKTLKRNSVVDGVVEDRQIEQIGEKISRSKLLSERYDFVEAHPEQLLSHEEVFGTA